MWWLLWIINKHYQGRLRVRTNCFWTHKGGFNFRIAKASINLSIRPWRLLYNTTNADLMSTLWPVSTKCFAIEEDVCLSCDLIWPFEFIWFCSHLGMCSATLICRSRLLLPMYVFPHIHVNWYTQWDVTQSFMCCLRFWWNIDLVFSMMTSWAA